MFYSTFIYSIKFEKFINYLAASNNLSWFDIIRIKRDSFNGSIGRVLNDNNSIYQKKIAKDTANDIYRFIKKYLKFNSIKQIRCLNNDINFEFNLNPFNFELMPDKIKEIFKINIKEIMCYYDILADHSKKNIFKWYDKDFIDKAIGKQMNPIEAQLVEIEYEKIEKFYNSSKLELIKELSEFRTLLGYNITYTAKNINEINNFKNKILDKSLAFIKMKNELYNLIESIQKKIY